MSDLTVVQLGVNYERCMRGDSDAIWIDRRGQFVQEFCDRLLAMADGPRALINEIVASLTAQARLFFPPPPEPVNTAGMSDEELTRTYADMVSIEGDVDLDDEALPEPTDAPQPASPVLRA